MHSGFLIMWECAQGAPQCQAWPSPPVQPHPLDLGYAPDPLSIFHSQEEGMKRRAVSTSLCRMLLFLSSWPEIIAAWQVGRYIVHPELLYVHPKIRSSNTVKEEGDGYWGQRAVSTASQCKACTYRKTRLNSVTIEYQQLKGFSFGFYFNKTVIAFYINNTA